MNISRNNYEEFFLLYVDNELSAAERAVVEQFVHQNPDLRKELEQFQDFTLSPEDKVVYTNKEALLKPIIGEAAISAANYEEFFVLYADDELSNEEKAAVEEFVYRHPEYQVDFDLLPQLRMIPDNGLIFADKERLYRTEKDDKVIPFPWWRVAAAAMVILVAGLWWLKSSKQTVNEPRQQLGQIQKPIVKEKPDASSSIIAAASAQKESSSAPKKSLAASNDKNEHEPVNQTSRDKTENAAQPLVATNDREQKKGEEVQTNIQGKEMKSSSIVEAEKKGIDVQMKKVAIPVLTRSPLIDQPATILNPEENTRTTLTYTSLNEDNVEVLNTTVNKKNSFRSLLRKASRFISKKTNSGDGDGERKGILIGSFEIAAK